MSVVSMNYAIDTIFKKLMVLLNFIELVYFYNYIIFSICPCLN